MLRRILGAGLVILYITPALALSQLCSDENVPIPGVEPASLGSEPYDIGKKAGTSCFLLYIHMSIAGGLCR